MYSIDNRDTLAALRNLPHPEPGAPLPIVFADENKVALAYWVSNEPPYQVATAPIAIIRFIGPYFHQFGPPNEEAIAGHPLASKGLYPEGVFQVGNSSLVRSLERMNSVHTRHDPARFARLNHYIFTFHDSTFECVAESMEVTLVHGGKDEAHAKAFQVFESR